MKNFILDNSLKNLGKVVLWQYDRAVRLLSILKHMQVLFHVSVERFWQFWLNKVLSIETCGEFGCTLWSQLLGVSRPTIVDETGTKRFISAPVFRRVLKGQFFLMKSTPSVESISNYLEIVFGVPGEKAISNWVEEVSEYGWKTNAEELNSQTRPVQQYHVFRAYEKGSIFQYAPMSDSDVSNWKVTENISEQENVSWEAIESKVEQTDEEADYSSGDELVVMKLYDPNGFCRKMAGASRDSLSISLTYVFGNTEIDARISRRRKSGVAVVDDGEMAISYAKTEYFDNMLPDQKYLYEQCKDTICPYPIGIRTNEPVEEQVFGFEGQDNKQYESGKAYAKGAKFGYVNPNDGSFFNWECKEDIGAAENSSFENIKKKLKKTNYGDPFIGNLVDVSNAYQNMENVEWFSYVPYELGSADVYITPKKWPAVAQIMPEDRYIETQASGGIGPTDGTSFFMLDSCCVYLKYDCLFLGRYSGTVYLYKIPMPSPFSYRHDMQNEVTDGKTYVALFTEKGLQIITPKMPRMGTMYLQTGLVYVKPPFDEFGVIDAVGEIAHEYGWMPIAALSASKPIEGCQYVPDAGFEVDNNLCYKDMKKVEPTTLISNSTMQNLKR